MFGVDPDIGSSALRLWVAAGSAALLVFVLRAGIRLDPDANRGARRRRRPRRGARRDDGLGFLDAASFRDRSAERRALEMRAAELNAASAGAGFCRWPASTAWPATMSRPPAKRRCSPRRRPWPPPHPMSPRALRSLPTWWPIPSAAVAASPAYCCRYAVRSKRIVSALSLMRSPSRDDCSSDHCKALALLRRSGPSARKFERANARSLSRSLFARLGEGARCRSSR